MRDLGGNQILITLSEDGKLTSVQIGDLPMVAYDSCPKKPYENIQNSINSYIDRFKVPERYSIFKPKGCWYDGDGDCNDCN